MEVDKKFTSYVLDSLKQMGSDPSECTVMVDNVEFKANKLHLRTCSKVFKKVFSKDSRIVIKGIKAETYKVVHQALLTGKIALNEANMVDVWFASSYLNIKFLPGKCEDYILQKLNTSNYLILYNDVLDMGSDAVSDKIITLIVEDFERFSLTQWFLELPTKKMMQVVKNSKSTSLDTLAQSVNQWLEYDQQGCIGKSQVQVYDELGQAKDASESNVIQTHIFNRKHIKKCASLCTIHSEDRKALRRKLIYLIMNFKFSQFGNNSSKVFTKIMDEDVLQRKVYEIPSYLAMLYAKNNFDCLEFDHIQAKAKAEDEPVIVFLKNGQCILYSLNTYEFYVLKTLGVKKILTINVCDNELYVKFFDEAFKKVLRSSTSVDINVENIDDPASEKKKYIMAYPFIYRFVCTNSSLTVCRFCIESEDGQWTEIDQCSLSHFQTYNGRSFYNNFDFNKIVCTENKVLFIQSDCTLYFDLKQPQLVIQNLGKTCTNIKCMSSKRFDYLAGDGKLFKTKDNEIDLQFDTLSVWDSGSISLLGTEFYDNKLFIFTSNNLPQKNIKENLRFEVKFVKIQEVCSEFFLMTVPPDWLTHKI